MPAQHPCPSCGFVHDSEGNEVAPIIVQQVAPAPAPPPPPPPPHRSSCPICMSKGLAVHFDNPDAFNAHMEAGNHRAPGEPEPEPEVIREQLEDFKLPDGGIDYDKLIERVAAKMPAPIVPAAPAPAIDYKEFVAEFLRQQGSALPATAAPAPAPATQEQESH